MRRAYRLIPVFAAAAWLAGAESRGQNSSLYQRDVPKGEAPPATVEQSSWTYPPAALPKELRIYSIINVRIDVMSRMTSEGGAERRKNALYDAVLKDWVHLVGLKAIKPDRQADGDQKVKGELKQLYRAESELETSESLRFEIAAQVADIRPNGNIVLEAHQLIHNNNEAWEYSLSGECRPEDIGPGNVVLSRDIYGLRVEKRERGLVWDGYRRGWFTRWLDQFSPF
jgi:flagellar L-ring protein precursor FlgH